MKGKGAKDVKNAKINRIFTAIGCLAVALALAAFTCFAWFTTNKTADNSLTATVSSGNISDLTVHYYSLTGKTESSGTTTYTVYKDLGEEEGEGAAIGAYGSTESTATLIKVSYTVKDGTATQIIFAGSGTATFPADSTTTESGTFYTTTMSSAVSLRLTDSNSYTITSQLDENGDTNSDSPSTITTSKTAQTFCDVSGLSSSGKGEITETNIAFTNITGTQNTDDGYYYVTRYIVMEYSDDNVLALYQSSDVNYSIPLSCSKDITLAVKDNTASTDVDTGGSSEDDGGSSGDSGSTATVSSVTISGDSTVEAGSTITLTATVTMSDESTYDGTVSWSSSDTGVATVSGGVVTGVAAGTATITATAGDVSDEITITVTAHTSTFSISELEAAILARLQEADSNVTSVSDSTQLAKTDFKGSNAFLTLLDENSNNKYRTNNNGVIEIKGSGLSVTFTGTGTLAISFASTDSNNVSSLALLNSSGYYITGTTSDATAATDTTYGTYYTVTGSSTYVTVTFTVTTAGTYTIATNVGSEGRAARISSIVKEDNY